MKTRLLFLSVLFAGFVFSNAQTSTSNRVSPLDSVQIHLNDLDMEVIYSRPYLKGREFGKDIVPFGKVWRTGANEATVFEISRDVLIEGKKLEKGKYSLYTIPNETETVVIFNRDWNQWGTIYNEDRDALRVTIPTIETDYPAEQFTISLDPTGDVCMTWGEKTFVFHVVCPAE